MPRAHGVRSLPACRAITLTTICVTTQRAETSGETTRVHALFKATIWRTWVLDGCAGRHRAGDSPVRGLALSKRGYTGAICARARPEHVFQASRANAKISLSDQRHESRQRRTRVLDGCVLVWDGARKERMHKAFSPSEGMQVLHSSTNLLEEFGLCLLAAHIQATMLIQ